MTVEELLKKLADAPKDAQVRLSTCMDTERAVAVQIGLHGVVIEGDGVDEEDEEFEDECDECGELINDCDCDSNGFPLALNLDASPEEDESEPA